MTADFEVDWLMIESSHPTKKPWSLSLPPRYCSNCFGLLASTASTIARSAAGSEICSSPFLSTSCFTPPLPLPLPWRRAARHELSTLKDLQPFPVTSFLTLPALPPSSSSSNAALVPLAMKTGFSDSLLQRVAMLLLQHKSHLEEVGQDLLADLAADDTALNEADHLRQARRR